MSIERNIWGDSTELVLNFAEQSAVGGTTGVGSTFFKYPPEIRKFIYTTTPIESVNYRIKSNENKSGIQQRRIPLKIVVSNASWG